MRNEGEIGPPALNNPPGTITCVYCDTKPPPLCVITKKSQFPSRLPESIGAESSEVAPVHTVAVEKCLKVAPSEGHLLTLANEVSRNSLGGDVSGSAGFSCRFRELVSISRSYLERPGIQNGGAVLARWNGLLRAHRLCILTTSHSKPRKRGKRPLDSSNKIGSPSINGFSVSLLQ